MKSSTPPSIAGPGFEPGRPVIAHGTRSLRRVRLPVIPSAFTAKKVMPCCDKFLVKHRALPLSYSFLTEADGTRTRDTEINSL
jgi:hypothetical protein